MLFQVELCHLNCVYIFTLFKVIWCKRKCWDIFLSLCTNKWLLRWRRRYLELNRHLKGPDLSDDLLLRVTYFISRSDVARSDLWYSLPQWEPYRLSLMRLFLTILTCEFISSNYEFRIVREKVRIIRCKLRIARKCQNCEIKNCESCNNPFYLFFIVVEMSFHKNKSVTSLI